MDALTLWTVAANLLMGVVYVLYGSIALSDVRRKRGTRSASHLGYAFVAIMWTCGPHHVEHGLHLATGGGPAGVMDLIAVALGLPVGLTWFALRLEARRGGPGDRQVTSDAAVDLLRTAVAVAALLFTAGVLALELPAGGWADVVLTWRILPNALIAVLYVAIASVLLRTQLRRHTVDATWSLSGFALTGVFASCAVMHLVWIGYVASGRYEPDTHLLVTDTLGVPAAAYFVVVAWLLGRGSLPDWTEASGDVVLPAGAEDAELDELLSSVSTQDR